MSNLHFRKIKPSSVRDGLEGRENGGNTGQQAIVGSSKKAAHMKSTK